MAPPRTVLGLVARRGAELVSPLGYEPGSHGRDGCQQHGRHVTHLVTAERALMNGTVGAAQVGWVLIASAALTVLFAPLTMLIYRTRR